MTFAERAEKRARAIYEAALFSTLMQQESEAAAASEDEFGLRCNTSRNACTDDLQGIARRAVLMPR